MKLFKFLIRYVEVNRSINIFLKAASISVVQFPLFSGLFLEVKVELLTTVMMENGKDKCSVTEQHVIKSQFCSNLYLLEYKNHYENLHYTSVVSEPKEFHRIMFFKYLVVLGVLVLQTSTL